MPDYGSRIHEIPNLTSRKPADGSDDLSGQLCEPAAMASNAWNFMRY